ncbi:dTDP-glucose 4,6-dehydratase [archaeon]|nr:dTDP-glucose 4,6-dehydratase [archaeon]
MRIVVTGGAGFIGSNFIKYMLNKYPDYKITNIDKLTYAGNLANLTELKDNKNYTFLKADINDEKAMAKVTVDQDLIINFAAESHVDNSITSPKAFLETDVFGTFTLLEQARKNDIPFFQISTDEVYGQIREGSFTEKSRLNPRNPYSVAKLAAERLTHSYFTTYKLKTFITRGSNTFGPNQHTEKLIPRFITNLLTNKKVPVYGTGLNVRDWLYVFDHCSAIDTIFHNAKPGSLFNIGGGNERTNLWITKFILKELSHSNNMIEFVKDRPGHDFRYALDCQKIKDELGWQPESTFESSLKDTIKWYKKNTAWWQNG